MSSNGWGLDLYLIPSDEDEKYILYCPSKYIVALLNPDMASKLATTLQSIATGNVDEKAFALDGIEQLRELGFLDASIEDKILAPCLPIVNDCRTSAIKGHATQLFSPHEVTLDITHKCNMQCIYCYSRGGETTNSMNPDCGRSAIEFCVPNAKRKGTFFGLHFHGGGEPSQEFSLLNELWLYAKQKCDENNVELKSSIITNGLISSRVLDFYAEHIDEITLSFDGDKPSHDEQRPSSQGGSTFAHVFKTGKRLLERKRKFNIRTTVTAMNVERLETIVEFLISEFPGCAINLEPVTLVGRALGKDEIACDPILFADHLFASMKIGIKAGVSIFYSGVSGHSQRQEFCAASAPSFCVCPDGSLTSCFSYSNRDVVRDLFVYGRYSETSRQFEFNPQSIERLKSLTMVHDGYCDRCFCRSHCIGDCPALRKFELTDNLNFVEKLDMDFMFNRRCASNRRIVTLLLNNIVRGRMNTSHACAKLN